MDLTRARQHVREMRPPARASVADLPPALCLAREGDLEVYYAPFDSVNAAARLTIVGLTPGWQQTRVAISRFLQWREQGCSIDEAQRHAKAEASFAGSMRANLVAMLDDLGLADALNVPSCTDLFDSARGLLHTTSALRYPVFFKGRNYSGTPRPTRIRVLRRLIDEVLAPELGCVSNSLIIPLGKATSECLEYVSAAGRLSRGQWLSGFPHPSGLNGHRVRTFRANRDRLAAEVARWSAGTAA